MTARSLRRFVSAVFLAAAIPVVSPVQSALAAPCSDVEVVFARGTAEPGGELGVTGVSFVEALRANAGGRSVGAYGVDYPASSDFADRLGFAQSVVRGIDDAQRRVEFVAANCPGTRIVLGGYSQGAALAGFATGAGVPEGVPPEYERYLPEPMRGEVVEHVAAVVLFGKPSERFLRDAAAPALSIGASYRNKTIDLCIDGDNICDGSPLAYPNALHTLYSVNGMTVTAAQFAAQRF
ncbi:cutinase family protein [Nocardia sp. GTS18]|uniref:cutinase family protein n=1 Tax=Nocardia sp. GTS18 TaxID=1778064 RepID=UPI0015EF1D52|nr:cutinase family protein [Nocardia sp. GTS18]